VGHRSKQHRHPVLRDWAVGEWCPEAVGIIRGYPKTPEAYAAHKERLAANSARARRRGRLNRRGVPNGYAGQGHELTLIRENARCQAERVVGRVTDNWDPRARLALQATYEIALDTTVPLQVRFQAARMVLEWLVPKPMIKAALRSVDPIALLQRLSEGTC
jgi:hypothetical protein